MYAQASKLFRIPDEFAEQQLVSAPHHEEIIVSCETPEGRTDCSFLLSDVPKEDPLHVALKQAIKEIIESTEPPLSPAPQEKKSP